MYNTIFIFLFVGLCAGIINVMPMFSKAIPPSLIGLLVSSFVAVTMKLPVRTYIRTTLFIYYLAYQRMQMRTHVCMYTHAHAQIHSHNLANVQTVTRTCKHIHTQALIHTHIHTLLHPQTTHAHIKTHNTHTHTYIQHTPHKYIQIHTNTTHTDIYIFSYPPNSLLDQIFI